MTWTAKDTEELRKRRLYWSLRGQHVEIADADRNRICERMKRLEEHNECLQKLLVCYRLGSHPSEKLLDRLAALDAKEKR